MKAFPAALLAILLVCAPSPAFAQLESCNDVGGQLNGPYCNCTLNESYTDSIGVMNVTTNLSSEPLAWMVTHIPRDISDGKTEPPDHRGFYLQSPPSIDLLHNTSIQACALIFNGVASKLKFNYTETDAEASVSRGTCEDALTAQCVTDWIQQARDIVSQTDDPTFDCQQIADKLRAKPPSSCHAAKKNWGEVLATEISGQNMPPAFRPDQMGCDLAAYQNYSTIEISMVNGTYLETFESITPIFTILKTQGVDDSQPASQIDLKCLKPVSDATAENTGGFAGNAEVVRVGLPAISWTVGLLVVMWLF